MKIIFRYIVVRITALALLIGIVIRLGLYIPSDTILYYLFSSIFQGLAALLGLLMASFIFQRDSLQILKEPKPIKNLSAEPKFIILEISISLLASIAGLLFTPFLLSLALNVQGMVAAFITGLTVISLIDTARFMLWCIKLNTTLSYVDLHKKSKPPQ